LLLRLPPDALDATMLDACVRPSIRGAASDDIAAFQAHTGDGITLLDWSFNDSNGEVERFWRQGDGPGWMARLLPLRDELLGADMRPLYLGWLTRVCAGELDGDDVEPPVPAGLASLTPAQQALVEFLELDPDWLSAAAESSPLVLNQAAPEYDLWLAEQTAESLRGYVHLLLNGGGPETDRHVRSAFLAWQAYRNPEQLHAPRRRVADFAPAVAAARERRLEAERQARFSAEAEHQAKRAAYLAGLATTPQPVWQKIDVLLKRGSGPAHDEALHLTKELAQALNQDGKDREFQFGLDRLLDTHGKRPTWVTRLQRAGLLQKPTR